MDYVNFKIVCYSSCFVLIVFDDILVVMVVVELQS